MTRSKVRVLIRVRPQLPRELAHQSCVQVDGPTANQEEVYNQLKSTVDDAFDGFNATLLAYGQTGTGKTHTLMGPHHLKSVTDLSNVSSAHGIIPRALHDIFTRAKTIKSAISIRCSYMEVYNDHLYDLLQPYKHHLVSDRQCLHQAKSGLAVREDASGATYVQHLLAAKVGSLDEVMQLIKRGNDNRSVRQTEMNQNSSRGHAILQLLLEQRPNGDAAHTVTRTKVNFVDLAGSERFPADATVEKRVVETNAINVSLSALASVVAALTSRAKHVPYRDSKLTHLLKDSLGGNCNTCVIGTLSPGVHCFEESVSTLKFADRAASIVNNTVKNVQMDLQSLIGLKDQEIERLRAMVAAFAKEQATGLQRTAAGQGGAGHSSDEQANHLHEKITELQNALERERSRAKELEAQVYGLTLVDAPSLLDTSTSFTSRAVYPQQQSSATSSKPGTPMARHAPLRAPSLRAQQDSSIALPAPTRSRTWARAGDPLAEYTLAMPPSPSSQRGSSPAIRRQAQAQAQLAPAPGTHSRVPSPYTQSLVTGLRTAKQRSRRVHAGVRRSSSTSQSSLMSSKSNLHRSPSASASASPSKATAHGYYGYKQLLEMYKQLAIEMDGLSGGHSTAHRGVQQRDRGDRQRIGGGGARGALQSGGRRNQVHVGEPPQGLWQQHSTSVVGGSKADSISSTGRQAPERLQLLRVAVPDSASDDAPAQWGLQSILRTPNAHTVPRGESSTLEMDQAQRSSNGGGSEQPPSPGFGLSSVVGRAGWRPGERLRPTREQTGVVSSPKRTAAVDQDNFDVGSWIYIMGSSANSTKAKRLALRSSHAVVHYQGRLVKY